MTPSRLSSVQVLCVVIRLFQDRRQHTANTAQSDHGLVNRNVTLTPTSFGLWLCIVNPVMDGRPSITDTERLKNRRSIRTLEASKMELNTELHQQFRCRLSFHET